MPVRKIWFDKMIREMEEEEEKRRIDFKEKIDGVKLAKYKRENPSLKNRLETTFKSLTDKIDESDTETEILIDKVIKLIEEIKEDEIILKNEKLDNGNVNGDRLECPFGCNSFRKDPKLMLKHIITKCQKRGANSKCYKSAKTNINSLELEKDIMGKLSKMFNITKLDYNGKIYKIGDTIPHN